jgi:DNA-binding response OmpR family regulator
LSAKKFVLFATLIQRPGQVFTCSEPLDTAWDGAADIYANGVELYVSYLSKKLGREGKGSHIRTVRGVGCNFDPRPAR